MLKYPPFAASAAIEAASRSRPPLQVGSRGPGVAILQGALIDLGYKLPRTLRSLGRPDGIYGKETSDAVVAFQSRKGLKLKHDGIAGKDTVAALDQAMLKLTGPLGPSPSPVAPPPMTDQYQLGTMDPPPHHDPGAGAWSSKAKTASHVALKEAIIQILPHAYFIIGANATKHMAHYLGNSGNPYTIDLEGMVRDVPSARARYEEEVDEAKEFVEMLSPGTCQIASRVLEGGYNLKSENWNWFFAIGGYSRWGKGTATVTDKPTGREFALDFEYKFYDRYNWDKGKHVKILNITVTDEFMGEFQRQGLAKEFDCFGSFRRHFAWKKGQRIPKDQLDKPVGGR
jgi:hypothetical protein